MPRRTRADRLACELGDAIRETRERRGETLDDVAHRIEKMDSKYIGELELGWHVPKITTVKRVADGLFVSLSDLFKGL